MTLVTSFSQTPLSVRYCYVTFRLDPWRKCRLMAIVFALTTPMPMVYSSPEARRIAAKPKCLVVEFVVTP